MERSSFCVHPSAKKRIKSLICHWRELPSLVQIMLLPRHQINLSDIPLTFFSRLARSWISSFMINWYKGYLTYMIVFHHYLLHWKTLQEWFSTRAPHRAEICYALGQSFTPTYFIRSLWRRHLKQLTPLPGKAAKRGSWDDVLILCLIINLLKPPWLLLSLFKRKDLPAPYSSLSQTKILHDFLDICNDSQQLWNEVWIKRHSQ